MLLWKTLDISDNERVFVYVRGQLQRVLEPGRHRIWHMLGSVTFERFDITEVAFKHDRAKFLVKQYGALLQHYLEQVELNDKQVGLLYRENKLVEVLKPNSTFIYWKGVENVRVECFDKSRVVFDHPQAKFVVSTYKDLLNEWIDAFDLGEKQVGLFYRDSKLVDVIAPCSYFSVWKGVENVRVELLDIGDDYEIDPAELPVLGRGLKMGQSREIINALLYSEVPDQHVGLLLVNGKLQKILRAGVYGYWKYNRSVAVKLLDLRVQSLDVSGQEILTKDRVSLRLNLSALYRIVDPELVATKLKDYANFVYQELQLLLREAVGTKTLDQLLENKDSLNSDIRQGADEKLKSFGMVLDGVGVKDIILPGDMKAILNQVVEAQKEAEANLIKRREETQAMRSLHNTAKMMENNPVLLRLKELEALERVTTRIEKITVFGGLNGVMNDLVKLSGTSSM